MSLEINVPFFLGIGAGADLVGHYEGANFGITWANIFEDEFSMAWIIGLLLIDTFLYAAVAWYGSENFLGFYMCFQCSY
jgi:hypothetical protein